MAFELDETDEADGYVVADAVQIAFMGSGGGQAPNGVIDTPGADVTIAVGETVNFSGTGASPDSSEPLTYLWNFGSGSGLPESVPNPTDIEVFYFRWGS